MIGPSCFVIRFHFQNYFEIINAAIPVDGSVRERQARLEAVRLMSSENSSEYKKLQFHYYTTE